MRTRFIPVPRGWQGLKYHPLACLVEFGAGLDVDNLAAYMREHGYDQDDGIVVHEGMILDGRHRHAAAIKAEVVPTFRLFEGKNAFAYVAKKIHRQHLSETQRAIIAAKLADLPRGNPTLIPSNGGIGNSTGETTNSVPTQAQAAAQLNVSPKAVERAKAVEKATPELQQAVADGVISLTKAAELAKLSEADQKDAVKEARKPKPRKQKAKPKSGSVKFDWKKLYSEWGALYRAIDRFGNAFECKESEACEVMRKELRDWKAGLKGLYKRLTKNAAPEE